MSLRNHQEIVIILICFIILIMVYYRSSDSGSFENSDRTPMWTVLIYMSGENHLGQFIPIHLNHLESIGLTDDINLVILTDETDSNDSYLYHIKENNITEFYLNVLDPDFTDELNMGDNATLEAFGRWAIEKYPADHYLLQIWGHGAGWTGVAYDGDDPLTMQELDSALNAIVEANNGEKLDVIGFDACDMGMLEVFYQVKDYADIAIASEKGEPEMGWPNYLIYSALAEDPDMSPKELAQTIVDQYIDAYATGKQSHEDHSIAIAAFDLGKIDKVVTCLEPVWIDRYFLEFYENQDNADLYHYALKTDCYALVEALNESIIVEKHMHFPGGKSVENAHGMTIYYPEEYDDNYDDLKFAKDTEWDEFLKEHI